MKLTNFEDYTPSVMQDRGYDYFINDHIQYLHETNYGIWEAKVSGNYADYKVKVEFGEEGEIKNYRCNCPFEGAVCKHVVAVLYKLKEMKENNSNVEPKNDPVWKKIINTVPENEMKAFLIKYAESNDNFKKKLLIEFPLVQNNDNSDKYIGIIEAIFEDAGDRYGYVDYREEYDVSYQIEDILSTASKHIGANDLKEAFYIIKAVAEVCVKYIGEVDDSDGSLGDIINEAFDIAGIIFDESNNEDISNTCYQWVCSQMGNGEYRNYGVEDSLEEVFFSKPTTAKQQEYVDDLINRKIEESKGIEDWSSKYQYKRFLKMKISRLEDAGKLHEAERLVDENLNVSDLRQRRIDEYIGRYDYNKAIELLHEGITLSVDSQERGTVQNFREQLYNVFDKTEDAGNKRIIAKELFESDNSSITSYSRYKSSVPPEEWDDIKYKVIARDKQQQKSSYYNVGLSSFLGAIYIEEEMWDELYKAVKSDGSIITVKRYAEHLKNGYSEYITELYYNGIEKMAENTGRDIYEEIANYLKEMSELEGGKTMAENLKNELLQKYKNRRAMKEVLGRLRM